MPLWAGSYDAEKTPLIAVEEAHVVALVGGLRAGTVLDVGAGTGRHALWWARHGADVTALDLAPEMLAVAARAARAAGVSLRCVQGDFTVGPPFPSGSFHLVI